MNLQELQKLLDDFLSEHFIDAQANAEAGIATVDDIAQFVKKQQYKTGLIKVRGIINRVFRGANKSSLTRWNNS